MKCDDERTMFRLQSGESVHALLRLSGYRHQCILVHGNPGSLADWQPVLRRLEAAADVVALDLPGFGQSARPGAGRRALSLTRMAECVKAVTDALSWQEPVFVVGHSHGGGVAQALAAQHPSRVAGIVLVGSLGSPAHSSYRMLSTPGAGLVAKAAGVSLASKRLRPIARWLMQRVLRDIFAPESVSTARAERELEHFTARPHVLSSMVDVTLGRPCQQLFAGAAAIRCPVLFLHGASDKLVPLECARAIHREILRAGGESCFEVFENAGHMLLEFQADRVAARIMQFMEGRRSE